MTLLTWVTQLESVAFIILFIVVTFTFILTLLKTPAMTFLKAFLTGKMVGGVFRRDRRIHFKTVDFKAGTGIDDKRYGLYNVPEDSVFNEVKSGSSFVTLHSDIGMGLSPKLAEATSRLESMGIKSAQEAEWVEQRWYHCPDCKTERVVSVTEVIDPQTKSIVGFKDAKCPDHPDSVLTKAALQVELGESPRESMKWRQIKDFISAQINPTFLKTMKERDVDDERQDLKNFIGGQAKFVGLGMAIFLACLGVLILIMFMPTAAPPVNVVAQCQALMTAAGCGT